jgi:hypothetical protein
MSQDLDNVLEALKRDSIDTSRLRHLESDVWQRITVLKAGAPTGLAEHILATIFRPEYRLAPMAVAVILGLSAGNLASMNLMPQQGISKSEMLNFEVFSSQSEYLVSSNLLRN